MLAVQNVMHSPQLLDAQILESSPFTYVQKMNLEMILADNWEGENLILKEEVYEKKKEKDKREERSVGSSIEPALVD